MSDTTRALFAPDPTNTYRNHTTDELAAVVERWTGKAPGLVEMAREEISRRADVARAVELWERLCAVDTVRGETQGNYQYSTAYLSPVGPHGYPGNTARMPDVVELEALILSDGEETEYPAHDLSSEHADDTSTPMGRRVDLGWARDTNPWSYGDRLYPITLTLISCGDYHGTDFDAANNRALKDHPGVDFHEPNTGGMGSVFNVTTVTVGDMTSFANAQGDEPTREDALMWLEDLVDTMEGLSDYPLIDEEKHREYVAELAEEAWDSWLESDTFSALRDLASSHLPGDQDADEWIDGIRAYEESDAQVHAAYYAYPDNEWTCESATSVVNERHDDAVKHAAAFAFLIGTCDCYVCKKARDKS